MSLLLRVSRGVGAALLSAPGPDAQPASGGPVAASHDYDNRRTLEQPPPLSTVE